MQSAYYNCSPETLENIRSKDGQSVDLNFCGEITLLSELVELGRPNRSA